MRAIVLGVVILLMVVTVPFGMAASPVSTQSKVISWTAGVCVLEIESLKVAAQKADGRVVRATMNTVVIRHKDGIFEHATCGVTFDDEDLGHATTIRSFSSAAFD